MQLLTDCFSQAAKRFGHTVSIKKTEIMFQPKPGSQKQTPTVFVDGAALRVTDCFCYLRCALFGDGTIENDVKIRVDAANSSFGMLEKRL